MDDDTFTNDATIEVDMDGLQEDQTTEYEMTDEVESYAPEMVDIEVEDAQPPQPAPLMTRRNPTLRHRPHHTQPISQSLLTLHHHILQRLYLRVPNIPRRSPLRMPIQDIPGHSTYLARLKNPYQCCQFHLVPHFKRGICRFCGGGAYAEVPVSADVLELQHEEGDHEPHTMPEEEHVPTNEPSGHPFVQPAHVEEEYAAEATCQQLQQTENAEVAEQQQPETAADETCAPVESNDPHEISEGVPTAESPGSDSLVLLHHQPVLYYEPLSSVFDALRREEYLMNSPDLRDGELILDAYDLQLAVSEDNVYAREVTLHDLNVIHDGSDIAGPLRLRLRSSVPRFAFRLPQRLNNPKPMPCPSRVYHRTHRQTHPKMTVWKRIKTKQPRSHSYLRKRSGMTIMRAQTDPNDTQEGEHEGPNTYDSLPEEDAHAVDGAGEPFAAPDVPDVYEEAETGEESTVAQESNDYAEDDGTHEDVEQDYPDLPDDDDGDDGPEAAPHEVVDEPVLPTVLDTSDETREPPLKAVWAKIPMKHQQRNQFNKITLPLHMSMPKLTILLVEEPFVPTELTDAAEAAEQAGSSIEIGILTTFRGVNYADQTNLKTDLRRSAHPLIVEPNLQEINEFEEWDDELDGDGELDSTWDEQESPSAQSSVTFLVRKLP
ncbi:Superoxide-generating NADPH oxidase heavy chain [Salix suchowensis]|nr:Superoxide-generating NADPH oxidase heavy chain [Salix suchowensis]